MIETVKITDRFNVIMSAADTGIYPKMQLNDALMES